jgi:hypothetical protein
LILDFLQHESSEKVLLKAVYCLSSAIRQYKSNFDIFMKMNGLEVLKTVCSSGVGQLVKRVLFLVSSLVRDQMVLEDSSVAESVSDKVVDDLLAIGLLDMVLKMMTQQAAVDEDYLKFMITIFTAAPRLLVSEFGKRVSTALPKLSSTDSEVSKTLDELIKMFSPPAT